MKDDVLCFVQNPNKKAEVLCPLAPSFIIRQNQPNQREKMLMSIKLAASAVAAIITTATINNTVETFSIINSSQSNNIIHQKSSSSVLDQYLLWEDKDPTTSSSSSSSLSSTTYNTKQELKNNNNNNVKIKIPNGKSKDEVIQDFQRMSRKELLILFQYCDDVLTDDYDLSDIQGSFDGVLLNNNLVLVCN